MRPERWRRRGWDGQAWSQHQGLLHLYGMQDQNLQNHSLWPQSKDVPTGQDSGDSRPGQELINPEASWPTHRSSSPSNPT